MSVATPMVSPSMVSEARSLWARRASKDSARLSRTASIGVGKHFQLHSFNPNSVFLMVAVLVNSLRTINRKVHKGWAAVLRGPSCPLWFKILRDSYTILSGRKNFTVQEEDFFMSKTRRLIILAAWSCIALTCRAAAPPDRQVAITIDDLPAGNAYNMTAADITEMTTKLLAALRQQKIPVVGFVNRSELYRTGEVDERIKALDMWLDAGFELGNHTFSHTSLNKAGIKAWEEI